MKETGGGDKEQPAGSRYASTMNAEMEIPSCVRGYHVYKDIWAAVVGELLIAAEGSASESDPLGSGSNGLK